MNKLLVPMLFYVSAAQAADIKNVNCDTAFLYGLEGLGYFEKATFPNEPEFKFLELSKMKSPLSLCGVTITKASDGNVITVKATSFKALTSIASAEKRYGDIKRSMIVAHDGSSSREIGHFTIEFNDFFGYSIYAVGLLGDDSGLAVAATFDGGKLRPLLYNGEVSTVSFPKTTKMIDIYLAAKVQTPWQRVSIDLRNFKMTIYKKAKIPVQ